MRAFDATLLQKNSLYFWCLRKKIKESKRSKFVTPPLEESGINSIWSHPKTSSRLHGSASELDKEMVLQSAQLYRLKFLTLASAVLEVKLLDGQIKILCCQLIPTTPEFRLSCRQTDRHIHLCGQNYLAYRWTKLRYTDIRDEKWTLRINLQHFASFN